MADSIIKINSITELHEKMNASKPVHPLVSALKGEELSVLEPLPSGTQISLGLYQIWLKGGSCGIEYGRKHYDFEEGFMNFSPPHEVATLVDTSNMSNGGGWAIFFHADLIRPFPLGDTISSYSFFDYETHEALHLSDKEKATVTEAMERIREEIDERIDNHSQRVLVSNIELLLN